MVAIIVCSFVIIQNYSKDNGTFYELEGNEYYTNAEFDSITTCRIFSADKLKT